MQHQHQASQQRIYHIARDSMQITMARDFEENSFYKKFLNNRLAQGLSHLEEAERKRKAERKERKKLRKTLEMNALAESQLDVPVADAKDDDDALSAIKLEAGQDGAMVNGVSVPVVDVIEDVDYGQSLRR
ncbi:hypothetical protein G7Y89_g15609 [Cudoniella acicularis]|uniref:Uncharacterized protein n=1 Tax=Cudoniella acicularis TaxID=354080 RepID=A0A8H4QKB4_9HELO|nr:hypothetical protein G7Y89_g15609 [Cudoniella acicularis]